MSCCALSERSASISNEPHEVRSPGIGCVAIQLVLTNVNRSWHADVFLSNSAGLSVESMFGAAPARTLPPRTVPPRISPRHAASGLREFFMSFPPFVYDYQISTMSPDAGRSG